MDETHFDAIVVGSGFGGSVMAYRLAEAGLRVCLVIAFGLFFLAIRGKAARAVSSLSLGSAGHPVASDSGARDQRSSDDRPVATDAPRPLRTGHRRLRLGAHSRPFALRDPTRGQGRRDHR